MSGTMSALRGPYLLHRVVSSVQSPPAGQPWRRSGGYCSVAPALGAVVEGYLVVMLAGACLQCGAQGLCCVTRTGSDANVGADI